MKKYMNWPMGVLLLVFAVASIIPTHADAQILKNLGRKVEKKVENQINRRVERRIDKAIDKTFDTVEEGVDDAVKGDGQNTSSQTTTKTDGSSSGSIGSLFGGSQNVAIKDQYTFVVGVSYDMTSTEGTTVEKLPGTTLWLSNEAYIGMASQMQQGMFMVMDEGGMITFMEDQKRYMAMSANAMGQLAGAAAEQAEFETPDDVEYSFKRVGSEAILGLPCEIYEIQTDESKARVWITQAVDIPTGAYGMALASLSQMQRGKSQLPDLSSQPSGLMLKMESTDQGTGQQIVMEAIAVHRDGKTFQTAGYQSLGL